MEQLTLAFLREQIIKMAGFVEDILKTSMDSDLGLQDLFPLEDQVNRYHKDIDDGCFKFIALKKSRGERSADGHCHYENER